MAVELRELLEKRNRAVTEGRAFIEKAEKEGRNMTEDETRQCDALLKEAGELRDKIDREIRMQDEERANAEIGLELAKAKGERGAKTPEAEARSAAFAKMLTRGMEDLTGEEKRALIAGSDVQGGFIGTPQEFVKTLITRVKDLCFIRGLATTYATNSNEGIGAPTLDVDADDAEWTTEVKKITEDDIMRFGKREIKPHPVKKRILISDKQLRSEAIDSEALVIDRSSYKFAITEEKAFLLGSGNQQPLGLFTASAAGINTDRDVTTAYSNDFSADDILNVKYSLKSQYMSKASWLFNRSAVLKIAKLKDGDGQYLFEMTDKLGELDQLKGSKLYMSEYVPNTFTASQYVGMFADFSHYWICDSLALRIKRLNELYAENSLVGFIFEKETDAAPVLPEAFARIKTGTTDAP